MSRACNQRTATASETYPREISEPDGASMEKEKEYKELIEELEKSNESLKIENEILKQKLVGKELNETKEFEIRTKLCEEFEKNYKDIINTYNLKFIFLSSPALKVGD